MDKSQKIKLSIKTGHLQGKLYKSLEMNSYDYKLHLIKRRNTMLLKFMESNKQKHLINEFSTLMSLIFNKDWTLQDQSESMALEVRLKSLIMLHKKTSMLFDTAIMNFQINPSNLNFNLETNNMH